MSTDPESREHTARYLEALAIKIMEAQNRLPDAASIALLERHLSPDFEMTNNSFHECPVPPCRTLDEHIENCLAFHRENPGFTLVVQNVVAEVSRDGRHATMWMTFGSCGERKSGVFNREGVSQMHWFQRKSDGVWVWHKNVSIRGPAALFGS